jgi:hypothetical protein
MVAVAAVMFLIIIEIIDNCIRKLIWGQTWTEALIVVPIIAIIILIIACFVLKKKG